ncbi:MAG: DinB family protein [Betaproteobacteria bacterium]|nr:DinB family protein [Betaproteobacteria bacterium]
MAEYNRWMNLRLYEAAAKLSEAQLFEDRGAFFGSLFDTLNHIAVADLIWLHRFVQLPGLTGISSLMTEFPSPTSLRERVAHSLPELRELRTRLDEIIVELAGRVTEQHLAETLRYGNTAGQKQAKNFGLLLQHFFNHQTHHRGQATTLLFQAGVDVGVTDLNALIANEV